MFVGFPLSSYPTFIRFSVGEVRFRAVSRRLQLFKCSEPQRKTLHPCKMSHVPSIMNDVCPNGNVPFSWEAKPGVSKPASSERFADSLTSRLPPPPCRSDSARFMDSDNVWKMVSPPPRSKSGRFIFNEPGFHFGSRPFQFQRLKYGKIMDVMNEEDPFFEAYKNCTKSPLRRSAFPEEDIGRDNTQPLPKKRSILSCFSS